LDVPKKAQIYSKIDLRSAYYLVCIAQGNKWKTLFRIRYGSYEWLVIPFGLSNASFAFQRFMNKIFSDLLDICIEGIQKGIAHWNKQNNDVPAPNCVLKV